MIFCLSLSLSSDFTDEVTNEGKWIFTIYYSKWSQVVLRSIDVYILDSIILAKINDLSRLSTVTMEMIHL